MSKTKTKQARRQLKRDGQRKIAEHQKKLAKAAAAAAKPSKPTSSAKPQAKKQKTDTPDTTKPQTSAAKPAIQASQRHEVPFGAYDHILLVGEGDFSFTRSLVEEHGCANVTATSFDSESEVLEKYPTFEATRESLTSLTPPVPLHHGIDATKLSSYKELKCRRDDDDDDSDSASGWDTIAFLFPHVGGLSTDVNRQVRSNQALLVSFFKSALETSTPKQRLRILEQQANRPNLVQRKHPEFLRMGGKIMVALFEGEPYTLWNIRDLARHAGLKVVESWRFDWSQYPGYSHVRTLGALEGGGGWKGEDREARMYVFEKVALEADSDEEKELEKAGVKLGKKRKPEVVKKKRKAEDDDSD
jgi:25S rRNA (uracil2634-N3)-methyltransferase